MILPLIGLILSVILTSTIAIFTILISKKWKLNLLNIFLFDFGAFISFVTISIIYNIIFSNDGTLESSFAVISYFIISLITIILGGRAMLSLFQKLFGKM